MGLACVSLDLDSLPHYCRIHGLPESILDQDARNLVYRVAVQRSVELFSKLSIPATLFAVGADLSDAASASALRSARAAGFEVGNHSHTHDYALTRRPDVTIALDVERAEDAITEAVGERPIGYRAPGYALSAALYQVLCDRGYQYDSSVFPAAPYFAAKAALMGVLAIVGRPSRAILDNPRVLLAPREPYWPDSRNPYRRGSGPLLELPIATSPVARFPFIGTFAAALPTAVIRPIYRSLRSARFFNFELHAVDLLDTDDGIPIELGRQQRDLRVPHLVKISRLNEVLRWLRDDFELTTLAGAASKLRAA